MKISSRSLLLMSIAVASLSCGHRGGIEISDAWVRAAPPGSAMTAAYMTIANNTGNEIGLVSISSPEFAAIEIHATVVEDELVKMRRIEKLTIGPHARADLAPGGMHIMLMRSHGEIRDGDTVRLEMKFDNGEIVSLNAPVRREL